MKNAGFAACSALLIVAGALAIYHSGSYDGLTKIGNAIGNDLAARQMQERDARDESNRLAMKKLAEERAKETPRP
jgi:hypothetical protein